MGNRNYQQAGIPEVKFAHRDLEVVRTYLIHTLGFDPQNIIEERDATKGVFETLFGTSHDPKGMLYNWVRPGVSRVFVYYVGHGAPSAETGEAFFMPVDANPDYVSKSGYPVSVFYSNLEKLPAKEVIIVLDA